MPIYEYHCPSCHQTFEELVRSERAARTVRCPHCGDKNVTRQPSVFAAHNAPTKSAPPGGCGNCRQADGTCPYAQG